MTSQHSGMALRWSRAWRTSYRQILFSSLYISPLFSSLLFSTPLFSSLLFSTPAPATKKMNVMIDWPLLKPSPLPPWNFLFSCFSAGLITGSEDGDRLRILCNNAAANNKILKDCYHLYIIFKIPKFENDNLMNIYLYLGLH